MKRNDDLIREMLRILEALPPHRGFSFEEEEAEKLKCSIDEIEYNLQQAEEMGFIKVGSKPLMGKWKILGLTPEGHNFLKPAEVLTIKPAFSGMSINLKALWRRIRHG